MAAVVDDVVGTADDGTIDLDFTGLDITTEDFDETDDVLGKFQEDDIVKAALDEGVDLRNYARSIDRDLRSVEAASINDYVREADNIAQLFKEVSTCESVLMTMQEMLQGFRSNLGGISEEIKTLQNDSLTMNIKLRNRRVVAGQLTLFLEKVAVSEDMINVICDGEIDATFIEHLKALSEKLQFTSGAATAHSGRPAATVPPTAAPPVSAGAGAGAGGADGTAVPSGRAGDAADGVGLAVPDDDAAPVELDVAPSDTLAGRDALPELDRLRIKAVTRVREFLLLKVAELRQPKTNVQKLQEYVLLKYSYLMQFLSDHSRQLAAEVKQAYIDSMGKMLANMFKTYHNCLAKLELQVATKNDLIAVEQNAVRSLFSTRVDLTKRTDAFCLGSRARVLDSPEAPPIHIHVAQAEKKKFPYEVLFRSLQKHLMDAASAEFSFTSRFFGGGDAMFRRVFAKSVSQVLENLEDFLCQCYDAVGLLLMIHITLQHQQAMEARRLSCLDSYLQRVTMLLWPRFKAVFDLNLQSVRLANPRKLGHVELHPHYITRRFAEFSASVITLHRSLQAVHRSDDMVLHNMTVLRGEVLRLLQRLAEVHANHKERTVFLINNTNQCISVFRERSVPAEDVAFYQELLARQIAVFVEAELSEHFQPLINFVKKTEAEAALAASSGTAGAGAGGGAGGSTLPAGVTPRVDPAVAETLVRDFARIWKPSMAQMNASVLKYFASFENGLEILKQTLTQLLLYHSRFAEIIKRSCPSLEGGVVRIADLFAEVRKFSRTLD